MPRYRGIPVCAVLSLMAGCAAAAAVPATSTVQTTATATASVTATTVETSLVTATTTVTSVVQTTPGRPDPGAAGPDGGPTCPVDPAYHDEDTDGLAAEVIAAWTEAETAAAAAGVTMCVNDGKRSRAQQQATYDDYVDRHGAAAAEQYVLPPDRSAHVAGYAVDVQPAASAAWLEATNGSLGFCRMYDNEVWHFEFAETFRLGCPPRRAAPQG
ncbi:D-alanyl-D-alanine carboxypeptidase family protein [Nakamurella deserti]|uniref:D-alanyl-D-alanine carboxypeptidase family protein n=1 Tax=Nakamurella deserti TaxID=2164074 RepID=UPI0013009DA4|nr:D-alanyl-D-alanine carboxypeptidase family protein [Nakamurella deserti]